MSETFESSEIRAVRRNPWVMGLAASPLLLTLGVIVASFVVGPPLLVATLHPSLLALGLSLWAYNKNPWPRFESATVKADRDGLRVGDRYWPRSAIRQGLVVPPRDDKPMRVIFRQKKRFSLPIELEVASAEEGRRLLHALGLDASQTVATFNTMSRAVSKGKYVAATIGGFFAFYGAFLAAAVQAPHHPAILGAMIPVFVLALMAFVTTMAAPTKVDVGADGIALRWLWRKRFIPFGEISAVTRFERSFGNSRTGGVDLLLESGESVRLPVANPRSFGDRIAALEERIEEAMDTYRKGGAESDEALLRRAGRELPAWIAGLRALGAGANADMRTAPLPRERLFRIVEDPSLGPSARAAAAVALGAEIDGDGRARLRAAAEATAAPRLRIAIEKAAGEGGEDEAIGEALAEIEAEEAARVKAS
jgi:hypothetical protein